RHPVVFEEFFDLGLDETKSPFLTPSSRAWGHNLTLKVSIFSACLLVIAFAISFHPMLIPLSNLMLILIYVIVGLPSLIDSIDDLLNIEINIDLLMTLAAFSSALIGSAFEGALLLVLFAISHAMEHAVSDKAKSAINSLTKLSPTVASVVQEDGTLIERSVKDISVGTQILVKAGQVVPLDGKVIEGTSSVNLVHLTGENLPVTKGPGDEVPSGGTNLDGALIMEVTHTSADSTLSQIIKLVTQAQQAKPELQRWFDKLSRGYASTIIGVAFVLAMTMPLFLDIPYLTYEGSVYRSLAFLIAASPCALIIAIPIAYLSAIGICAKNGILLKGGITLDALATCKVFAFDKTGTLTTGVLHLKNIETKAQDRLDEALSVAYALERNAIHPIANAITAYAKEKKIELAKIHDFKAVPGYGLEAKIGTAQGSEDCVIGHVEFIANRLPDQQSELLRQHADEIKNQGDLVAVLLMGTDLFLFHFEDTPRPKIRDTLRSLHEDRNMRLLMLTGDHEESARKIAEEMSIDEYYSNLRPEDKLLKVSRIAKEKGLAMVGDGINDAPALARATVGICMGQVGSTAAVDAADVILLQDNIEQLDWLVKKAHQTQKIVKQNLTIATVAIIFASIPALAGLVPLWLAVILHEGGTVIVGLNALRLLYR
ncbi:MAG: cation-translocating P-type ATPase, partial [Chlamydiota bacterium]